MTNLERVIERLKGSRRDLLRVADLIPPGEWRVAPGEGRWSVGEVAAHLAMVERSILKSADRITQKEPKAWPFYRRFHLPFRMVEKRWIRRKAPKAVVPQIIGNKEEMLGELRDARERTLAFLEETKVRDLTAYRWPHPFLGTLSVYEWMQFVASHEIRHTKQMQEIAADLPKNVSGLHK